MKRNRRGEDRKGEKEGEEEGEICWYVIQERRINKKRKKSELMNSHTSYVCRCVNVNVNVQPKYNSL